MLLSLAVVGRGGYAPSCRTVYETVEETSYEEQCDTVYRELCHTKQEEECRWGRVNKKSVLLYLFL